RSLWRGRLYWLRRLRHRGRLREMRDLCPLRRLRRRGIDEIIAGCRRDDTHLVAFEQRGAGVVDDAVARGNPLGHFDSVVNELAHGDQFQVYSVVLRHHGHLRTVLLEHQSGRRDRECFLIDRRREVDLGVRAGPERWVLVVDRKDGYHGTAYDIDTLEH